MEYEEFIKLYSKTENFSQIINFHAAYYSEIIYFSVPMMMTTVYAAAAITIYICCLWRRIKYIIYHFAYCRDTVFPCIYPDDAQRSGACGANASLSLEKLLSQAFTCHTDETYGFGPRTIPSKI